MNNSSNYQFLNTDILNLFTQLLEKNQNEKSCIFDASSVLQVLKLAYHGIGNKYKNSFTDLQNIIEVAPKPMDSKSAVLIKNNYKFKDSYKQTICDDDVYFGYIPTSNDDIYYINNDMNEEFIDKVMSEDAFLVIKNKSIFHGKWVIEFDETKEDNFYVSENKILKMPMMSRESIFYINTFKYSDIDSLVICLEYVVDEDKDDEYKMLIIKPNKPKPKKDLIKIIKNNLNGEIIRKFLNNMTEERYTNITMPKFKLESKWDLKEAASEITYLKNLYDGMVDYTNISSDMIKNLTIFATLKSESILNNNENGTSVISSSELYNYDSISSEKIRLDLNSSFIFMIMDHKSRIVNIGLFVG